MDFGLVSGVRAAIRLVKRGPRLDVACVSTTNANFTITDQIAELKGYL